MRRRAANASVDHERRLADDTARPPARCKAPSTHLTVLVSVSLPCIGATFPLIVTPVHLPWFDEQDRRVGGRSERGGRGAKQLPPHVLFVGLAFLADRRLTIDCDAGRMTVV